MDGVPHRLSHQRGTLFKMSAHWLLAILLVPLGAKTADAPTFPTNEDMRHFGSINDPELSPDGQNVLLRVIDSTANGGKSHLWLVNIPQNTSRQLTYSPESDKAGELAGVWSPDGSAIYFLAKRTEHTQLFRLPFNGGEAKAFDLKVTPPVDESKLPDALPPPAKSETKDAKIDPVSINVSAFEVSPDGKSIAIFAADPQTPGEKKAADAKADAKWVDHDLHGRRIYLLNPDTSTLTPVAVPMDVHGATWKRDSSKLLAIAEEPNGADDLKPSASAWLVSAGDPTHPEKLSELPTAVSSAAFSEDGDAVEYLSQAAHDAPPGFRDLYHFDLTTRKSSNLTDGIAGSVGFQEPITMPDGSTLVGVGIGVETTLLRLQSGKRDVMHFAAPVVGPFHTNAKHSGWVFLGSSSSQPTTLYFTSDLAKPAQVLKTPGITPTNNKAAASKRIEWTSDGLTIQGLFYLPTEASNHKVPLVVEVHGGPLGAYVDNYEPFVNFLVGHGWAVLRTNPRGSTNYGAAFAAANKNDLGGGDYRDIMAGLDCVLKTEPIDPDKLALEGYSYGGEMAGFVEGKTSRFKAIISGAPVIDQYSEYGTEGGSWYDRWYFGKPWEHPQDAWRQSPLSGVGHATTPFLLLQGESDTTDPLGQSQEMYRALRQMGVPVDLVTYPRDNHGPLARGMYGMPVNEPWHGFDARQRLVQFIEKSFK